MKNILLSSAVIALLSTTAMAGTVIIAADNAHPAVDVGPIITATEGLAVTSTAGFDLDPAVASPLGNAIGRALAYNPSIALNDDDTFILNLSGATFTDTSIHLVVDEANAGGNGVAIDVNADGDTSDVVEIAQEISRDAATGNPMMRIVLADGLTADTHMMIVENTTDVGATPMTETENPVITIDSGATAVTLAVTDAQTGSGIPLSAANAAPATLFTVRDQIAITFGQGTSTIDANNARTQFIEEGAANDIETTSNDTDLDQSASTITFSNNIPPTGLAPIDDFIADAELNTLTLTLTDTAVFESVNIVGGAITFDDNSPVWNAAVDGTDKIFSPRGIDAIISLTAIPTQGHSQTEDIIVDVDGTVLKTRTIGLTAALDFVTPALADVSATESAFITWNINGYQATIQDIRKSSTYNTAITLYNNHPVLTAEVEVTAVDLKTGLTLGTATLKDIKPNSRQAIAASTIEGKIPAAVGKAYRADLTTTIPTASGDCDAWQLFKGASIRTLPVADNNAGNDANNDK